MFDLTMGFLVSHVRKIPGIDVHVAAIFATLPGLRTNRAFTSLWLSCQQSLSERATLLLERYDHDSLRQQLGDDMLKALIATHTKRIMAEKRMAAYRTGRVVEPRAATWHQIESLPAAKAHVAATSGPPPADASSRSETTVCYPLASLLQGVAWPPGIDPAKRERYLTSADFMSVFGMSRADFEALRPFVQMRLKKAHGLF